MILRCFFDITINSSINTVYAPLPMCSSLLLVASNELFLLHFGFMMASDNLCSDIP